MLRRFAGHAAHAEHFGEPLRIAHLTDMHVGLITPDAAQRAAIALTNAARPELVCLTGDFVGFGQSYLGHLTSLVAGFEAPVVAVLGNHDHWAGAAEVRKALEHAGALVLQNEWSELELGGRTLQVVGVDDAYTGHQDAKRAVKGLRAGRASLGLSHVGEVAPALWAAGVPLVLSGHTHAGHVTWAGLHRRLVGDLFGHRFVHGLYGCRQSPAPLGALYVAAGIGSARIPLRLGDRARREVALFDLGLRPGAVEEHHDEAHPHQRPRTGRVPPDWLTARRRRFGEKEERRRELQATVKQRLRDLRRR